MKKQLSKKVLSFVLTAAFVLSALPLTATAASDGFTYSILSETEKTVEISGYTGTATLLEIPAEIDGYTVVRIGSYAFYECGTFSAVSLPNTVTEIGEGAFASTAALTSIVLPSSVAVVEPLAFANCGALTSIGVNSKNTAYSSQDGVLFNKAKTELITYPAGKTDAAYTVPKGVTDISVFAFFNCVQLQRVVLPRGVVNIGSCAFQNCIALTDITLEYGVTHIGEYAFYECSALTSISLPFGVTRVENSTFEGCASLQSVLLPNSIDSIGDYAFASCRSLTGIALPNSLSQIGRSAFGGCTALTEVCIPDRVTALDAYVFSSTEGLKAVTIPSSVQTIDALAFSYSGVTTVYGYTETAAETFATENGFTFIALTPPTGMSGDLNNDGTADLTDYALMSAIAIGSHFPSAAETASADLNSDTAVDFFDVAILDLVLNGYRDLPNNTDGDSVANINA